MAIEDETELEPWLKDQPTDLSASLALRAAFRVLPFIFDEWSLDKKRNTLSLWTLRATITAACSVQADDDNLRSVASTVAKRLTFIADDFPDSAFQWIAAADTAIDATEASSTKDSETASKHAYAANHDSGRAGVFAADRSLRQTIKHMMFRDCDEGKTSTQLLNDALAPVDTSEPQIEKSEKALLAYRSSLAFLRSLDPPWSFWSRWYERAMAGDPLPWDLQREVALIPDAIWDQGPEAVAERIAELEAAYLARTTQLAEEVTLDPETGTFSVTPRPLENAPLISALLARTEDALEDALHGQNGLREDMRAVRTLRRTHQRYGNDPQRIELDYTSVAISLRREIRETQELAETEDNLALLAAVEEGALAIRAQHPEVAENRQRIAQQRLREMDRADLEVLESAEPVLLALSEGEMAEDFARDIPQLINDATTPLPTGAPPLPGVDESMRVFHRVSWMKVLLDAEPDKGTSVIDKRKAEIIAAVERKAKQFDSPPVKAARLGFFAKDVLEVIWKAIEIGLKLFGVL